MQVLNDMHINPERASITTGSAQTEYTIYPVTFIELGTEFRTGSGCTLYRYSSHYSCSCPVWRYNTEVPVHQRTCEHLIDVLGDEYERVRTQPDPEAGSVMLLRTPTKRRPRSSSDMPSALTPTKRTPSKPESSSLSDDALELCDAPMKRQRPASFSTGLSPDRSAHRKTRVPLLLANAWPSNLLDTTDRMQKDPTGWWISEKLDGVRAWWDGRHLWSRNGQVWNAPPWFLHALPRDIVLDGELWIGRGLFEYASSICRAGHGSTSDEWQKVKFMVFDAPDNASTEPVEQRWDRLRVLFPTAHLGRTSSLEGGHVYMVEQVACDGREHLQSLVQQVLSVGGEGVMLRAPFSVYERRRSSSLYKWKPTLDAEARIVGYEDGQKGIAGFVGSFVCESYNDEYASETHRFRVGSGLTDALRRHPPPIGTIIRYQYGGMGSQGLPRFPRYVGIRSDM